MMACIHIIWTGHITFDVINCHIFFILNFQFGFLERLGRNKHKFTRSRFDRADELLHSTNGIVKGMWVFDITQKEPRTPELCPKQRMFYSSVLC